MYDLKVSADLSQVSALKTNVLDLKEMLSLLTFPTCCCNQWPWPIAQLENYDYIWLVEEELDS